VRPKLAGNAEGVENMDATIRDLERAAQAGDEAAAAKLVRERARLGEVHLTRWFIRCRLCLSVVAIETETRPSSKTECGLCGGTFEIMGHVRDEVLVKDEGELCPCDERCTHAAGPKCVCGCRSKNHGSGLVVPFVTGSIPRVTPMRKGAEALARAEEFRKAIAEALDLAAKMPRPDGAETWAHLQTVHRIDATRAARTHRGRMAKLAAITAILRGGAA
jgi:hypothetical protein